MTLLGDGQPKRPSRLACASERLECYELETKRAGTKPTTLDTQSPEERDVELAAAGKSTLKG